MEYKIILGDTSPTEVKEGIWCNYNKYKWEMDDCELNSTPEEIISTATWEFYDSNNYFEYKAYPLTDVLTIPKNNTFTNDDISLIQWTWYYTDDDGSRHSLSSSWKKRTDLVRLKFSGSAFIVDGESHTIKSGNLIYETLKPNYKNYNITYMLGLIDSIDYKVSNNIINESKYFKIDESSVIKSGKLTKSGKEVLTISSNCYVEFYNDEHDLHILFHPTGGEFSFNNINISYDPLIYNNILSIKINGTFNAYELNNKVTYKDSSWYEATKKTKSTEERVFNGKYFTEGEFDYELDKILSLCFDKTNIMAGSIRYSKNVNTSQDFHVGDVVSASLNWESFFNITDITNLDPSFDDSGMWSFYVKYSDLDEFEKIGKFTISDIDFNTNNIFSYKSYDLLNSATKSANRLGDIAFVSGTGGRYSWKKYQIGVEDAALTEFDIYDRLSQSESNERPFTIVNDELRFKGVKSVKINPYKLNILTGNYSWNSSRTVMQNDYWRYQHRTADDMYIGKYGKLDLVKFAELLKERESSPDLIKECFVPEGDIWFNRKSDNIQMKSIIANKWIDFCTGLDEDHEPIFYGLPALYASAFPYWATDTVLDYANSNCRYNSGTNSWVFGGNWTGIDEYLGNISFNDPTRNPRVDENVICWKIDEFEDKPDIYNDKQFLNLQYYRFSGRHFLDYQIISNGELPKWINYKDFKPSSGYYVSYRNMDETIYGRLVGTTTKVINVYNWDELFGAIYKLNIGRVNLNSTTTISSSTYDYEDGYFDEATSSFYILTKAPFNGSISGLFDLICIINNYPHVPLNPDPMSSYEIFNKINTSGKSYRNILEYIAEAYGGFIHCNKDGQIEFKRYSEKVISLDKSNYKKALLSNYDVKNISNLKVYIDGFNNSYNEYGFGENEYCINDNQVLYSLDEEIENAFIAELFDIISPITYKSGTLELYSNSFGINVGDIITVDGNKFCISEMSISPSGLSFRSIGLRERAKKNISNSSSYTVVNNNYSVIDETHQSVKIEVGDEAEDKKGVLLIDKDGVHIDNGSGPSDLPAMRYDPVTNTLYID